jgi:hypothetical protein
MASERASSQRSQALEQEAEKRRAAETRAFAADMARGELEDELRRLRSELHAMRQRSLANEAERNELVGELDDSMARLGQEAREATAALQHRCVLCIVLYCIVCSLVRVLHSIYCRGTDIIGSGYDVDSNHSRSLFHQPQQRAAHDT